MLSAGQRRTLHAAAGLGQAPSLFGILGQPQSPQVQQRNNLPRFLGMPSFGHSLPLLGWLSSGVTQRGHVTPCHV